jgi:hypothetical protein
LAGTTLDRHRHVYAFLHSRDEEYGVLRPFIKEGIAVGEKIFQIMDSSLRQEHVRGFYVIHPDAI